MIKLLLGLEFVSTMKCLVNQLRKYASDILKIFNMLNCNSTSNHMKSNSNLSKDESVKVVDNTLYKQMMGCLQYATMHIW